MAVIALAGRRVDAAGTPTPRFPPANVGLVQERIREQFERLSAQILVCSAACGADLLALAVAGERGIGRRVILPFDRARFRTTSVIDRGEEWGPLFDRILAELRDPDDVVTLDGSGDDEAAYARANGRILTEAQAESARMQHEAVAVLVWEGRSRGDADLTAAFGEEAMRRHLRVVDVPTR